MPRRKKLNIKLDDIASFQNLLQEVYHDACGQINDAQSTINNLVNSAEPVDTDDHTKIAKAKTDALKIKDSAIKIKLDVSRLQNDVIKNKGNLSEEIENITHQAGAGGGASLDAFSQVRKMIEEQKRKSEGGE
jgi:hypothetical protein